MMRRSILLSAVAVLPCFSVLAMAAPILTLSDAGGDPSSVQIAPGEAFTVTVTLNADQGFTGLSYFLQDPTATSSDWRFAITGRTLQAGSPLTDPTSSDAAVINPTGGANQLNPRNDVDLGYGASDISSNVPAGTYVLGTLTLTATSPLAVGSYTIQTANAVLADAAFNEVTLANSAPYTINVVPEPATVGLLALAGLSLLRRRS